MDYGSYDDLRVLLEEALEQSSAAAVVNAADLATELADYLNPVIRPR